MAGGEPVQAKTLQQRQNEPPPEPYLADAYGQNSNENKGSSANKLENDSNATLLQWQQKGLIQYTKNGSSSPTTGQSSNFHFSQFNYEFTSRNRSIRVEESSNVARKQQHSNDNVLLDDRRLKTQEDLLDGADRIEQLDRRFEEEINAPGLRTTKVHRVQPRHEGIPLDQ